MAVQRMRYGSIVGATKDVLGYESMSMKHLPMKARKRLQYDGFLDNAEDPANVIYEAKSYGSDERKLVVYNHRTGKTNREFDTYELAGVVEGYSLNDFANNVNTESQFDERWDNLKIDSRFPYDYDTQYDIYKKTQFLNGVSGLDVPRAFAKSSPIAAQKIKEFTHTHRALSGVINNMLGGDTRRTRDEYMEDIGTEDSLGFFRKSA